MRSPRSSIAATSSSSATFPSTSCSNAGCDLGLWRLTADKIAEIFGTRLNRTMRGKLATVIDRIEHGHHVLRSSQTYLKFPDQTAWVSLSVG